MPTPAANAFSAGGLQSHGTSNRSAHNHHRIVNKLPSLVDQRWPHPDRRVPLPPRSTPISNVAAATSNSNINHAKANTSASASIDVLKAAANFGMAKSTATDTDPTSFRFSSSLDDDDDDHHHNSGRSSSNGNNINTADHNNSVLTALPSTSFKPAALLTSPSYSSVVSPGGVLSPGNSFRFRFRPRPLSLSWLSPFAARFSLFARAQRKAVEPVHLWTAGQLARAQRARLADAMAAEIARLNAEVRRLEAVVGVKVGRGRVGVRESWVTVDDEWELEEGVGSK
ncbi:hypothetical protein DV736_g6286, partial [Chaetothyriales sp. CBS 134916]